MSRSAHSLSRANLLRRTLYAIALGGRRLRGRVARTLVPPVGIGLAAALLAALLAGSLAGQDAALGRATLGIPASERALRAVWGGTPAQGAAGFRELDRTARHALRPVLGRQPFTVALFRETRLGGALVTILAGDQLPSWIQIRSGRMPRPCRAKRCEVLQLAGAGPLPRPAGLRLVRVGRGSARTSLPFGSLLSDESERAVEVGRSTGAAPPFLLANGIEPLAASPALRFDYRTYSWVVPLGPADVHPWNVGGFGRRVQAARTALASGAELFDVTAPEDRLAAGTARARAGGRRLLLLGGDALALLLAFVLLAAGRLRADADSARGRLTWAGAARWQALTVLAAEVVTGAAVGVAAGWAAGVGLGALVARDLGASTAGVLAHSVLGRASAPVPFALAGVSTILVLAALVIRPARLGGWSFTLVDAAGAAGLAVILAGFAHGTVDASSLGATGGTRTLLLLLPGLICLVAAVVTLRAVHPFLRLVEHAGRHASLPIRLAALSLARRPGQAAAVAAFGAISVGLALFAESYRATLIRGQHDQAAFAVPADAVLGDDFSTPARVNDLGPPFRLGPLGPAAQVLRLSADVPRLAGSEGVTLLGLRPRSLERLAGWRPDFAVETARELARRIEPRRPVATSGVSVPADAQTLVLPVRVQGDGLILRAVFETSRGAFTSARLDLTGGARVLPVRLPAGAAGGRLVALAPELPPTGLHDSDNAAAGVTPESRGLLRLGRPSVSTRSGLRPLDVAWTSWVGLNGMTIESRGPNAVARYVVTPDRDALLRPRQATDGQAVPALVSPRIASAAGPGGALTLELVGQAVPIRVVGVARRFPSVSGDFVVADRSQLATTMNASFPGSAVTNEVWLERSQGLGEANFERAVERAPFNGLTVSLRGRLERELRADPLARGALLALEAAAAVALALALAGLLLAVLSDLGDERRELLDLEGQGAAPAVLRLHLRLRALLVWAFGLVAGIATGAVLSRLVVRLVAVTANAAEPEPPLLPRVDWGILGATVVAYAGLALLVVGVPTWSAFREARR